MTGTKHRRPVPDRARRRAVRALAARLGVPYLVAARLIAGQIPRPAADRRPSFPTGRDEHRASMFALREHRPFHARVRDCRLAADLPLGRAAHLTERFPPLRSAIGALYDGDGRETTLAMLYAVLAHESPALVPATDELAWVADLGEPAAVDITCAALDRAARMLLDDDRWRLWTRVEAALAAGESGSDRRVRDAAVTLDRELRSVSLRGSLAGVRHILDAVLVEAHEGHPPGARVVLTASAVAGTVVGACWRQSGPPIGYAVRLDTDPVVRNVPVDALTAGSEAEFD
ncbi:hypothetical protein K1W54_11470 [Micromonospora sp. CPCC 205371]|nr:hypothetical protein [Micromonospora sp. CPCC 205371]